MMNQLPKWTRLLSLPEGQQAVAWTLIALCLLPFVALSCYNHPTLDDILDAETVRKIGFWQAQKFFYFSHTGRYTTTMLLGLINPLCYGKWAASWWWVTLVFVFGTVLVLRYGMGAVFGLPARAAWLMAGLVLGLWLAYAPGLAEGLYWFTGAYTYIAAVWLLVAWLVALVRYAEARHKADQHPRRRLLLVAVLTVAVAGTPEPLALPFVLLLLLGTGLSWWLKRGRIITLLAALALAGSAVSFLAPGNFVRMGSMGESFGVFKTLVYSGGATAYLLFTWVSNPVLLALSALLLPALYRVGQQREHLVVRLLAHMPPGALALVLAGLMAAAGCPAYYASGAHHALPGFPARLVWHAARVVLPPDRAPTGGTGPEKLAGHPGNGAVDGLGGAVFFRRLQRADPGQHGGAGQQQRAARLPPVAERRRCGLRCRTARPLPNPRGGQPGGPHRPPAPPPGLTGQLRHRRQH